ncbi:hypothetical protein ACLOJK_010676 [Asimina triloba]
MESLIIFFYMDFVSRDKSQQEEGWVAADRRIETQKVGDYMHKRWSGSTGATVLLLRRTVDVPNSGEPPVGNPLSGDTFFSDDSNDGGSGCDFGSVFSGSGGGRSTALIPL